MDRQLPIPQSTGQPPPRCERCGKPRPPGAVACQGCGRDSDVSHGAGARSPPGTPRGREVVTVTYTRSFGLMLREGYDPRWKRMQIAAHVPEMLRAGWTLVDTSDSSAPPARRSWSAPRTLSFARDRDPERDRHESETGPMNGISIRTIALLVVLALVVLALIASLP